MKGRPMENRNNGLWLLLVAAALVVGFLLGAFTQAMAQTPPISQVEALADTTCSLQVTLIVEVSSYIPWDGQQVGIYWTAEPLEGWNYAGATRDTLTWTAPADDLEYWFASTVDDNEGNSEGYSFAPEAITYVCSTCTPFQGDCPPVTPLEALQILAASGLKVAADSPFISWYWTHPITGSPVVEYIAEWWVDGLIGVIPDIAVGDTTYAFWDAPYTIGQTQKLRVKGKDNQDREGPWSLWSEDWVDLGPPGTPEAPSGTLIMH